MKIRIVAPVIKGDWLFEAVMADASQFKSPDTSLEVVDLDRGPASIECAYDEALAAPAVVDRVVEAEAEGCDGVFVTCFGDPGVEAAREMVSIPVVGGFQPAVAVASVLAHKWSVVTVMASVIPMLDSLIMKNGLLGKMASCRYIDIPVLGLDDQKEMLDRLLEQSRQALSGDGAAGIILGCTGMLGVGSALRELLKAEGFDVPVIEPTAAAIGFLESAIRAKTSHSKVSWPKPADKTRLS